MSLFSRSSRKHEPASEPKFYLANPGYASHDLTQVVHSFFCATGMSFVVHGPGSAEQLFDAVSRVAPVFGRIEPFGIGLGMLLGERSLPCAVVSGPMGSAVVVFGHPEADMEFVIENIADPIQTVQHPWRSCTFFGNETTDGVAVQNINNARGVPLWNFARFASFAPASEERRLVPSELRAALLDAGWEERAAGKSGPIYVGTFHTNGNRSQTVYLTTRGDGFAVFSPVCTVSQNGQFPQPLIGVDFSPYTLDLLRNYVVLVDEFGAESSPVTVLDVTNRAHALAPYADRVEAALGTEDIL